MEFITDKQTLDDLNLLGKYKASSVFSLYNATNTRGGERMLEQMFRAPLTEAEAINRRGRIFSYFMGRKLPLSFDREVVDLTEQYLGEIYGGNRLTATLEVFRQRMMFLIAHDQRFEMLQKGLRNMVHFLQDWNTLLCKIDEQPVTPEVEEMLTVVREVLYHPGIKSMLSQCERQGNSWFYMAEMDYLLKNTLGQHLRRMLESTYLMDVYASVAGIAVERGFTVAKARPFCRETNAIAITDVTHPGLQGAVPNSIRLNNQQNVLFLTGANMAGKSTFMKSFSIAVYMAHLGFPVSARQMDFSVQDGLYTSINVPDNLEKGYSHFYAEVLRVKHIAEEVASGKNLVILFDELFKGTNVKDANEATVTVAGAFGENRNCSYIISTHIMEAGHTLQQSYDNFKFVYFPSILKGSAPQYTYKLTDGITNDRHGLHIIREAHIMEILQG